MRSCDGTMMVGQVVVGAVGSILEHVFVSKDRLTQLK